MEEYRYLNGWSDDKKKGSTRCNRIPVEIIDKIYINSVDHYIKLIPDELEQQFTSKDYSKASRLNLSAAKTALNVLNHIGAVKRVGKQAGLSWITVLKKREAYMEAFDGFDPIKVALYDDDKIESLMANEGIRVFFMP